MDYGRAFRCVCRFWVFNFAASIGVFRNTLLDWVRELVWGRVFGACIGFGVDILVRALDLALVQYCIWCVHWSWCWHLVRALVLVLPLRYGSFTHFRSH